MTGAFSCDNQKLKQRWTVHLFGFKQSHSLQKFKSSLLNLSVKQTNFWRQISRVFTLAFFKCRNLLTTNSSKMYSWLHSSDAVISCVFVEVSVLCYRNRIPLLENILSIGDDVADTFKPLLGNSFNNVRFVYSSIKILFKWTSSYLRELLMCSLINVLYQHFVFSILFSTMSKKNFCVLTLIELDDYSSSKYFVSIVVTDWHYVHVLFKKSSYKNKKCNFTWCKSMANFSWDRRSNLTSILLPTHKSNQLKKIKKSSQTNSKK